MGHDFVTTGVDDLGVIGVHPECLGDTEIEVPGGPPPPFVVEGPRRNVAIDGTIGPSRWAARQSSGRGHGPLPKAASVT